MKQLKEMIKSIEQMRQTYIKTKSIHFREKNQTVARSRTSLRMKQSRSKVSFKEITKKQEEIKTFDFTKQLLTIN